jgi:hypothetical protein
VPERIFRCGDSTARRVDFQRRNLCHWAIFLDGEEAYGLVSVYVHLLTPAAMKSCWIEFEASELAADDRPALCVTREAAPSIQISRTRIVGSSPRHHSSAESPPTPSRLSTLRQTCPHHFNSACQPCAFSSLHTRTTQVPRLPEASANQVPASV